MGRLKGSKNIPTTDGECKHCGIIFPKVRSNQEYCTRPCYMRRAGQRNAVLRGALSAERRSKLDEEIRKRRKSVVQDCILWREKKCGSCTAYKNRQILKDRLGCTRPQI